MRGVQVLIDHCNASLTGLDLLPLGAALVRESHRGLTIKTYVILSLGASDVHSLWLEHELELVKSREDNIIEYISCVLAPALNVFKTD